MRHVKTVQNATFPETNVIRFNADTTLADIHMHPRQNILVRFVIAGSMPITIYTMRFV